jgi:hypothetical protein
VSHIRKLQQISVRLNQVEFYLYRGERGRIAKAANFEISPKELNAIKRCVRKEIVRILAKRNDQSSV